MPGSTTSKLAVISQTPKIFDYPNIPWFPQFLYTGPFSGSEGREIAPFDWGKLTEKPLIYASLGTVFNNQPEIYKAILDGVRPLTNHQVVLSTGGYVDREKLGPIPENTIVVPSAPQIELLHRAVLCITHAGLNTVLEALIAGVPMVAVPIGYDQPGTAARIAYHGLGRFIELGQLTGQTLFESIQAILNDPIYGQNAERFRTQLAAIDGLTIAANTIEAAFALRIANEQVAQNT